MGSVTRVTQAAWKKTPLAGWGKAWRSLTGHSERKAEHSAADEQGLPVCSSLWSRIPYYLCRDWCAGRTTGDPLGKPCGSNAGAGTRGAQAHLRAGLPLRGAGGQAGREFGWAQVGLLEQAGPAGCGEGWFVSKEESKLRICLGCAGWRRVCLFSQE